MIVSARLILAASGQYIRLFGKGVRDPGNNFENVGETVLPTIQRLAMDD